LNSEFGIRNFHPPIPAESRISDFGFSNFRKRLGKRPAFTGGAWQPLPAAPPRGNKHGRGHGNGQSRGRPRVDLVSVTGGPVARRSSRESVTDHTRPSRVGTPSFRDPRSPERGFFSRTGSGGRYWYLYRYRYLENEIMRFSSIAMAIGAQHDHVGPNRPSRCTMPSKG
jgi:hypothetical protein